MRNALTTVALVMTCVAAVQLVTLVGLRGLRQLGSSPRAVREQRARDLLYAVLMGDAEESRAGLARAADARGRDWDAVEEQAFRLLAKVRGESHAELVSLLVNRGAEQRALRLARSRSSARRCRGAHRLGVLASRAGADELEDLLTDREFLVRRVAVRAVGQSRAAQLTPALVAAVAADPALRGDALAAVSRLGSPAAPALVLALGTPSGAEPDRTVVAFAAAALGVLASVEATPRLSALLQDPIADPTVRSAAAESLGQIGAPSSVGALVSALGAQDPRVVQEAARALGRIGDPSAVPPLGRLLGEAGHETGRAAAEALMGLGPDGERELRIADSAYALEALAVHRLRTRV